MSHGHHGHGQNELGGKNLRKNHFLVNFIRHTGPIVTRFTGSLSQLPVVEMSWGKKSKKKTKCSDHLSFTGQFHQTHWSHGHHGHHGHQVPRQPISASSGRNELGKKFKKKSILSNFYFLVNFIRHSGPMVTMVTRCTGSLSQLPVVKMSCRKKSKKNLGAGGKNLRKNQMF